MLFKNILLIVTSLIGELCAVDWGNLPPEIQKCHSFDNEVCVGKAMENVLKQYPTGSPELGLPNISALNVTSLKVSRPNANSPIQLNFEFLNCTIFGVEKLKVLKTAGLNKQLKKPEIELIVPSIRIRGDYTMTGKLLLLAINGKGIGEIELKNATVFVRATVDKERRDNKTYLKIKNLKAVVEPKKMAVKLENVFVGNPVLSETINNVINENWKDVWTEQQEGINNAMETIIQNLLSLIFEVLTLEDMFLD